MRFEGVYRRRMVTKDGGLFQRSRSIYAFDISTLVLCLNLHIYYWVLYQKKNITVITVQYYYDLLLMSCRHGHSIFDINNRLRCV